MLARATTAIARHPVAVGLVALVMTGLLAVPLLTMAPTSSASPEPSGPAFTARDVLDERLAPAIATEFVIVEARGAAASVAAAGGPVDVLDPPLLRELHDRVETLRRVFADEVVTVTDPVTGRPMIGTLTVADVVDAELAALGGIDGAPDSAVRAAVGAVVDAQGSVAMGLSTAAVRTDDGVWSSPALSIPLLLDNALLGGGNGGPTVGTDDTTREEVLREVRDVLRGGAPGDDVARDASGDLVVHAVAADVNLTAGEQGQAAGPFIGLVVLLTLLLVGLVFRSYWHVAIVGSGIGALMVWLLGASNLVGLEQDQILSTVVPIALVSFGVDFAFHALGRVREEREAGRVGRAGLQVGLAGVGGALLLALASDSAAFLANVFSGIESIVQFGVAATLGLTSAFLLLGVAAPTAEAAVAERVAIPPAGPRSVIVRVIGAGLAASGAMGTVLLTVYVAPVAGVALALLHPVLFVVLPAWVRSRPSAHARAGDPTSVASLHDSPIARLIGRGTLAVARRGAIVLPLVAVVTVVATIGALRVESAFDVEDFFAADTDFVAGLDALDAHVGTSAGETTTIVVETDVEDPAAMAALAAEVDALRELEDGGFAVDDTGRTIVDGGLVDLVRDVVTTDTARAAVEATGVVVVDADGDGIPDDADVLAAIYDTVETRGLPLDDTRMLWTPAQAQPVLDRDDAGRLDATRIELLLPGSREVTVITAATAVVDPRTAALTATLDEVVPGSEATATGSAVVRQRSLDAVSRALLLSLPIAVLACLAVALVAMRSVRYAVVAIVPILLVVPWLYGLMWAAGFSINLVTGTIGAISIGIGIDFAIHLVERFREELRRSGDRDVALLATGTGTGLALVASAASSIIGFGVLSLAPMPLFASYGLLTAIMVTMALVATLLVLPALLRATTPHPVAAVRVSEARTAVEVAV